MNRMGAMSWVLSVATDLRLSQAKTLSELVAATPRVSRMALLVIGRCLPGETTANSRIRVSGGSPATAASWSATL